MPVQGTVSVIDHQEDSYRNVIVDSDNTMDDPFRIRASMTLNANSCLYAISGSASDVASRA